MPGAGLDGRREHYFFANSEIAALRSGKWKYIRPGFRDSVPVLYNIEADPGETRNLRSLESGIATLLAKRIAAFR